MLRIWLFGVLRLEVDGVKVTPPSSRRARLLLAMLAIERRPHAREALATRLWPGVLDESARASLRTALAQVRATLGPDAGRFLEGTRERVALAGPKEVWTDVHEFERLLGEADVQAALALWSGELLTGLEDDWVHERRDELRQQLCEALGRAADGAEADGSLQTALALTRRRATLDPLAEEPHRELMRRLNRAGDRAAALVVYDKLSQRLHDQLGTVPSQATRELAAVVRDGMDPVGRRAGDLGSGRDAFAPPAVADGTSGPQGGHLPLPRALESSAASPYPLVGRRSELARLRNRWVRVRAGVRSAVIIRGEPGIGKTRLASEVARGLHEQGALVLYGRCDEGLAVPYQPFVEALRPYADAVGLDRLRTELGGIAPALGRLLPELAGLGEPIRADPESERFALFEAVAALLEMIAREQHVLLVLDDLHWAAHPTLLLLRHLIRSERPLNALLLCIYRETELDRGLAQLLADLCRDATVEHLSIQGLGKPAVAALLEAAVGQPLGEHASRLASVLATHTAGNPFFIRELIAHMIESGTIPEDQHYSPRVTADNLEAPETVRRVIGHRIARMSTLAGRALSIAAVAGPTFSFILLDNVLDGREGVLDAMDEAIAAGLLTEAGHGHYAFVHALVRQTIYEELSAVRRMWLHRQVGEALETEHDAQAHAEALAYHFAQAAADGQAVKAAAYALAAGRKATARLGYDEAAAHYERGLGALALAEEPQEPRRCELLLALAEARWAAGEVAKASDAYEHAAELAETLGDTTALARAALGFGRPYRPEAPAALIRPVAELLERALAALGDSDSALRARLLSRLAMWDRKPMLAREALQMARRVADQATLAEILASCLWTIRGPDAVHESLALTRELERLADDVGDKRLRGLAHRWLFDHLLERGDIDAVERELEALQQLANTRTERHFKWVLAERRANHAYLRGHLARCERLADDALAQRFEGHDEFAAGIFAVHMLFVRREQGRLDELVETVERYAAKNPGFAAWRCALVYTYAELGRRAQARQEINTLARVDFRDIPRDAFWLLSLSVLCDVVAFLDDVPRARLLYQLLLPYADRCVVLGAGLCQGSVSRPLGVLARTLSRFEDAELYFEHALKMNMQIKSQLWIAHTRYDYARMLLLRNRYDDRGDALALLDAAVSTANELGLQALGDKARALKLAAETKMPPAAFAKRA
jgi:DNA-binding SARP family transcriptional activator